MALKQKPVDEDVVDEIVASVWNDAVERSANASAAANAPTDKDLIYVSVNGDAAVYARPK